MRHNKRIPLSVRSSTTCWAMLATIASASPGLWAQTRSAVLPVQALTRAGTSRSMLFFREQAARRVQLVIGAEHLRGLAGKSIFELAFRKQVREAEIYDFLRGPAGTQMRVLASFSDASPARPSREFARNHSAPREVFRGFVAAPVVSTHDARAVASFAAHESPRIVFSRRLAHEAGKSLVLDFEVEGGSSGYDWVWPVDAEAARAPGVTTRFGQACWPSARTRVSNVVEASLRPGMDVKSESWTPPDPVAAFLVLGSSDKHAFGSLPLPLRISEPSCDLFVSPDVLVQAMFLQGALPSSEGASWAAIPTPYLPSLRGSTVYLQYLFLHREGAALRLRSSDATRATFAKSPPVLGASVVTADDKLATHGRVFLDFVPVLRLRAD